MSAANSLCLATWATSSSRIRTGPGRSMRGYSTGASVWKNDTSEKIRAQVLRFRIERENIVRHVARARPRRRTHKPACKIVKAAILRVIYSEINRSPTIVFGCWTDYDGAPCWRRQIHHKALRGKTALLRVCVGKQRFNFLLVLIFV